MNVGYDNTKNKKGTPTPLFADPAMFNTSYTKVDPPDYEGLANSVTSGYEDTKNAASAGPLTYNEQGGTPLPYNEDGAKPLSKEEEKLMMGDAIKATHSEGADGQVGTNL